MIVLFALVLLLGGTALLLWGADWFVDGIRDLARDLGISIFLLSMILAGLEPEEMITAAIASFQGVGGLALGDVIGTNITMMTLALGLSTLSVPVILRYPLRRQAMIATIFILPPLLLLSLIPLGRLAGLLLLGLYAGYLAVLWRKDRAAVKRLAEEEFDDDDDDDDDNEKTHLLKDVIRRRRQHTWLLVSGGLIAMTIGGPLIVAGATRLTEAIGLGHETIGGTIVALGTGAELIALGWSAARRKRPSILLGAVLGSFVYNMLVTLGLAALIRPLPPLSTAWQMISWIMIASYIFFLFLLWRGRFGRKTGIALLISYVLYIFIAIIAGIITV